MAISRSKAARSREGRSLHGKTANGAEVPSTGNPCRQGLFIDPLFLTCKVMFVDSATAMQS